MKIYCFIDGRWMRGHDLGVVAIAADGNIVSHHVSSSPEWAKFDIGITSNRKHDVYMAKYPDGYELEWVDDPETHEGLRLVSDAIKARAG